MSRTRREPGGPRGRGSLRGRVAWSATLVVAGWVLALGVGGNLVVTYALSRSADTTLRARAEAVRATVDTSGGRVVLRELTDDRALDAGTWVFDSSGRALQAPERAGRGTTQRVAAVAQHAATADQEILRTLDLDDPIRLLALPVTARGRTAAVVVTSASLDPYSELRRLAMAASAVGGLGLLVVVHLVLRASLARALAPVAQMGAQVDRWSTDDPEHRLGVGPRPEELAVLAATLDALLDRIAAVLRHEQLLTAELSHELRTPLAQLQAEVDWLRAQERTPAERAESLAALDASIARTLGVLDALLASARTTTATPGRCAVGAALEAAVADLPAGGAPVHVDAPVALVAGVESGLLERAVAPLLANAVRYAASRVDVVARADGGAVRIAVRDDGPGIPAGVLDRVLEPGFRGDPGDGHPGAGLGLALAHRLARGAGGAVVPVAADGGEVALVLPAA